MIQRLSDNRVSAIRALIRAVVVSITAFGLKLEAQQVAAIQLVAEALLAVVVQFTSEV